MAIADRPAAGRRVGPEGDSSNLYCPRLSKGIGTMVARPDAEGLIAGAVIEPYAQWPDDRGYFLEIARMGEALAGSLDPAESQVSAALSYPGTIKAFHYHRRQTDYWVAAAGVFQVALVDLRSESDTFGAKNTLFIGTLRPWRVLIPPGVAHGYKVVGQESGLLVYLTSRKYDPGDEGRIAYDDAEIAYDWEQQHK